MNGRTIWARKYENRFEQFKDLTKQSKLFKTETQSTSTIFNAAWLTEKTYLGHNSLHQVENMVYLGSCLFHTPTHTDSPSLCHSPRVELDTWLTVSSNFLPKYHNLRNMLQQQ